MIRNFIFIIILLIYIFCFYYTNKVTSFFTNTTIALFLLTPLTLKNPNFFYNLNITLSALSMITFFLDLLINTALSFSLLYNSTISPFKFNSIFSTIPSHFILLLQNMYLDVLSQMLH